MKALTKRQREVLSVITSYTETAGVTPTVRELMQLLGLSSPATVAKHIQNLEKQGFIKKTGSTWRAIKLTKSQKHKNSTTTKEVAIIGSIADGQKLELFAQPTSIQVPSSLVPKNSTYYAFVVKDSSFSEVAILSQDLLILEARSKPVHGETVVANSKIHGVKIARFLVRLGQEFLELESEGEILPLSEGEFRIQGILATLYRQFRLN